LPHRSRIAADLRRRGQFIRCSMKIGAIPENLLERLAMVFGLVPTPFIDTFHAVIVARAVMVATKLDVFDALASRPLSATELAAQLGLDAAALEKLLNVLVTNEVMDIESFAGAHEFLGGFDRLPLEEAEKHIVVNGSRAVAHQPFPS